MSASESKMQQVLESDTTSSTASSSSNLVKKPQKWWVTRRVNMCLFPEHTKLVQQSRGQEHSPSIFLLFFFFFFAFPRLFLMHLLHVLPLTDIVESTWFTALVFVMIALSSILIVVDDEQSTDNSAASKAFEALNIVIAVFFTLEMLVKWVAYGIVLHANSYFRSAWNILDFVIVVVSEL